MSKLSDSLAAIAEHQSKQKVALESLGTSLDGVTTDVQSLNEKITELQNSQGGVTPEDQATIDAIQTAGQDLATRSQAAADALEALNAKTPPPVPSVP